MSLELVLALLLHPWAPLLIGVTACVAGVAANR